METSAWKGDSSLYLLKIAGSHATQTWSFRHRNCQNTSHTPIDTIWTSESINILQGGYTDYVFITLSDHQCLWVDISSTTAFGHNMPLISYPRTWRLHCKDPRVVQNYIRKYKKLASKHDLLWKVQALSSKAVYPLPQNLQQEYESLDCIRCTITQRKTCRKLRKGQVSFSPKLQKASLLLKAYTLLKKKSLGRKVSSRLLARSLKKAGLSSLVHALTGPELDTSIRDAYQTYYSIKKHHVQFWQTHLDSLAEALEASNNIPLAWHLIQLHHRELQWSTARKIWRLRGKGHGVCTTMVSVTTANGGIQDITWKE